MSERAPDETLDASGLKCPLPVLKAKKALKPMAPGQVLRVTATDPGASKDFVHFCEATGDTLLASEESDGILTFLIEKAGAP
ncbi:MAG: sulfurtransferase TusA family protein [Alphaproteobacteria bacterium]|nr:sulfurtransferase TusA family protein [Alphaproteobacteria bacterium]